MERIEDINLPLSIVGRLIKEALPENVNLGKEAKAAVARAASIFILFVTSTSTTLAHKQKHKSIHPKNIFEALNELELESFVEPVQQDLEVFRKMMRAKKDNKSSNKKGASKTASSATNTNEGENVNINDEIIVDEEADVEINNIVETATNGHDDMEVA